LFIKRKKQKQKQKLYFLYFLIDQLLSFQKIKIKIIKIVLFYFIFEFISNSMNSVVVKIQLILNQSVQDLEEK